MPYDALGNYIPGDDEPSLDEMRLAVTQKAQPAYTQIPTQGYPKAPAPQRPLDTATQTFQDVATRYNPLMIMKALREGVGATIVNPVIGGLQGVATELQSPEFYDTSRTKPTGIAEGVAADFMQRNAPTTPLAQEFTEAIGKYTQDLPAYLGHLSTNRPVLTPNDVRVLGAEATRLGRQVRDIPSDFASAQAGAQRIDPITGQPTMGAKLQAGAESIGDLMERRRMQGLAPVPGLPETLQPETRMYAMRPSGSRIALPQVPPTKLVTDTPINIAPYRILSEIVEDPKEPLPTVVIENMIDRERIARNISAEPFEQWVYDKAYQLYPDAPTRQDALEAWKLQFSNSNDLARAQLAWLDEYLATPEGQASPLARLPSPTEIQERHKVASEWLYGPWLNYINKHVGASGDPAVKLASQGLTYSPASTIRELVDENVDIGDLNVARAKAGMPKEGEVAPTLKAKEQQLSELQADLAKWQTRRQAYRDIAERQGLLDPAQLPDYAATTDPIRELTRNVAKLEEEVDNLRLGKAYEDLSDAAVIVRTQPESLARLEYPQQQFYPSITRARPEDLIYNLPGSNRLDRLGLRDLAQDVYNDIMSGKILKEQVSKLSIDKLIREKAVPRIKQEKLAAQAQKAFKADAESAMQRTLRDYAEPGNYFGNVGVIELNNKMGLDADQLTKILSEATTVLDHCIAQGASAGERDNNPWMPGHKRKYEPIYNIVTGEKNPRAAREISSYAGSILNSGNMIADIRDRNTGIPVATLELSRSHTLPDGTPMYYVGWASGAHNGKVNPEYRDSIKEYLNARSDIIYAPGDNLARNLELYDTQSTDGVDLLRTAGISRAKASQVDLSGMPRFVTKDDIKAFVDAALDANQVAPTQQPAPARPTGFDVAQVNRDLTTAIDNAVQLGYDDYNMAVSDIVRDQVLRALPTNRLTEVTTPADMQALLRDGISLLTEYIDMSQLATSQNVQYAANPIGELIIDLQGINSAIERGIFTQEPTPPVPAVEPPGANEPQRTAAAVFRDLIDELGQTEGAQVADRVEVIAIRAAGDVLPDGSVVAAMRRRPAQFAQALRRFAQDEDSELVEMALHRLADEVTDFEPPPAQPEPAPGGREAQQRFEIGDFDAYVQRVNRDVGFTEADRLVRVANTIARDMGNNTIRLALENRPTQFAERLDAAAQDPANANIRTSLLALADEIAPPVPVRDEAANVADALMAEPEPLPDLFPELPGRQAQTINVPEMAFELFQDTRRGEGRDLDELRTTLQALETGNFDDMRFRALPADQRDRAQRDVAHQIRAIMDDLNITIPAEPEVRQQQQEVARYQPIADRVNEMTYDQLRTALTPGELGEVSALHDDIVRNNPNPNEIRTIAQLVYDHSMSSWENYDDAQRAMLYMELQFTANRMEAEPPRLQAPAITQNERLSADLRNQANDALDQFVDALDPEDSYSFITEITRALDELRSGEDEIYGLWHEGGQMPPALRAYLIQKLESMLDDTNDGNAEGGLIRGYQDGGSARYPSFFGARDEAVERSEEMFRSRGQDDPADAARHMLASGYMAQSLGPTIAKGLGWLHEFKEAPIRTAGHALGLSNPRYDYEMDMHNNALGVELAQKAKNRTDFEQMVKDAIAKGTTATTPGRVRLMTPEQAEAGRGKLKYANGGTVSQTPSLDAMKYELMMRSK